MAKPLAGEPRQSQPAPHATPSSFPDLLDALFESMPAAAWAVGLDGRYRHVTEAFARMVGRPASACAGQLIEDIMPPQLAGTYAQRHRQVLEGRARKRFEQIWPIDGEPRWFEIHMNCLLDPHGQPIGVAGYAQDVTQHMEQQEAARRVQSGLEKRVAQRTEQLTAANEELEAFSYSVSHDLRAPLRAIKDFAQLLDGGPASSLDEPGREYLHHIIDNSLRMDSLITALLHMARVNQGSLLRVPTDLSEIARSCLGELQVQDPARGIEFDIMDGVATECDAGLMRVALANLMGNAWKFTRHQPRPCIRFGSFERTSGTVYFVHDNGAGFAMQDAERMFGAFQRCHRESEFSGSGIGLATVKRVIARHGGQIWAEGSPGNGATFYFTLETAA